MLDYDRTPIPAGYDAGRGYSPEALVFWLDAIAATAAGSKVETILDLGCGTGRFSAGLASRMHARVLAIDPSSGMLGQARLKSADPRVQFVRAYGESLPIGDASVDLVFISMVFHHFRDPDSVAMECRRVLRKGGVLCLRGATSDRLHTCPFLPFFPRTASIMDAVLPRAATVTATFRKAGFSLTRHEVLASEVAPSFVRYSEKLACRADSILLRLTDDEFVAGLAALEAHARTAPPGVGVIESVHLFGFRVH